MGLRSRLKNRVRRVLGRTEAPSPRTPPRPAAATPVPPQTAAPVASDAPPAPTAATPPAATLHRADPPTKAPEPAVASDADAKAARHFERTRRAVLRFIDEQGGVSSLADMHDYSERKYFIGHRRFSDLMETLLDEGLIEYDHASGEATLNDKGRTLGQTKMPPRKRTSA